MRFMSWNVNGLRAKVKSGDFLKLNTKYDPDFICLQEIKMFPWQREFQLGEVYEYWNPSSVKGVSGTAIFTKNKAVTATVDMGLDLGDDNGRVLTLEYAEFYLVTVYVPTGTGGRRSEAIRNKLAWLDTFVEYVKELDRKKPIILCGDMNIAHQEIDLSYPDRKSVGFTDAERAVITAILESGFVDSFRSLHPDSAERYTWVSNRFKTGGLRLDYFFVSGSLRPKIVKADIMREEATSDHCPILLEINV